MIETMLRAQAHPDYMAAYHEWLADQHEKTAETIGASKQQQLNLLREYGERLANLTPDSPEGQILAAASFSNEALKLLGGNRLGGGLQSFAPSKRQREIIARLGTPGNGRDGKGHQDFEVTLAEMTVAVALDVKEAIQAQQDKGREKGQRIAELEAQVAEAQAGKAAAEAVVADRDADNNSLRQENKELGELNKFLQERLEALDGKPAPEPPEKKTIFGSRRIGTRITKPRPPVSPSGKPTRDRVSMCGPRRTARPKRNW